MASSMSGEWLRTDGFLEFPDPVTGVTKQFCSLTEDNSVRDTAALWLVGCSHLIRSLPEKLILRGLRES